MKIAGKLAALFLAAALIISGCGNVVGVSKVYGESQLYSRQDISDSMNVVIRYFAMEFRGCALTRLEYDESISEKEAAGWAEQYQATEAIVLVSDFSVGSTGGDGSLNPNSTYANWKWILTRSEGTMWKLQTWGYG